MTPRKLGITLTVFLLSAPCGAQKRHPEAEPVLELCDILARSSAYQGNQVLVRGIYFRVFHGSLLFAPGCSTVENPRMNIRLAAHFRGAKRALGLLNRLASNGEPVNAVFAGTFREAPIGSCFGQTCLCYELEATDLVSATYATGTPKPTGMTPRP